MIRLKTRRGINLIDVMITLFLLGITAVIFSTTFPCAFASSRQSQQYKVATTIAQRKMEQLRAMKYESLTSGLLLSSNLIDPTPTTSPYSFTDVDAVAASLPQGTGSMTISDDTSTVKRVLVTLTWRDPTTGSQRTLTFTTLFSDKRPRA